MDKQHQVLVVDDEADIRELLSVTLARMGHKATTAETVQQAKQHLSQQTFSLCITDMRLPDGTGLDMIETIQSLYPQLPVAMLTAYGNLELAIDALKKGAFDFVTKPVDLGRLKSLVTHAIATADMETTPTASPSNPLDQLIGRSATIIELKKKLQKVSRSQAPVLISGESGSGKELAAQIIHQLSVRSQQPFIAINCGAIPTELMESEFFGHKKGSFTGATSDKKGLFQASDGGTLFLDEVADLPLHMQVKLLRVIQEKKIRPVGQEHEISVDVRLVSASHKNLQSLVQLGNFREDLFYRLNVIDIHVPSLKERPEDIPLLSQHLLNNIIDEGHPSVTLADDAVSALSRYAFPGNIRELTNILQRAAALCDAETLHTADLNLPIALTAHQDRINPQQKGMSALQGYNSLDEYLDDIEKDVLLDALEKNRWNKTATAEALGISFRSIRYRLKKLGLED